MRRAPALLLLAALLGGLGASSAHGVHDAIEWAEGQSDHADDHGHTPGDDLRTPCADADDHALDCAVCTGVSGVAVEHAAVAPAAADADAQARAEAALHDARRAAAPARGPPAVA